MDRGATRSVTEPKRTVRYEARKERVVLPSPGSGRSGGEMVAQGARPRWGLSQSDTLRLRV